MDYKNRNSTPAGQGQGGYRRPVGSPASTKERAQFPAVGMTLRSYQYDPKDYYKVPAGRGVKVKQGFWQRLKQKGAIKKILIVLAIILVIMGAWLGGKFIYNFQKLFGGNIFGILSSARLKGENVGRVNILLAGNSADDVGHDGGELTDSIMLLSLDTKNNTAFLVSIPRDLWVALPSGGHGKINSVYVEGEAQKFKEANYPPGGMGALEETIEDALDIDINYYALVNYKALKDAVNAVGGIDFTVKSEDPRGLYDPSIDYVTRGPLVKLSNGKHHLNGQQALNLARARGDHYRAYGFAQSDFNRTENQRQIIVALKSKMASAGVLANPAKLTSLSDAVGRNVKTDFSAGEIRRFYDLIKHVDSGNIKSLSFNDANGKNLFKSCDSCGGVSALIPALGIDEYGDMQAFLKQQMSSDPVVREGASIVVLNGTESNGLASKEAKLLKAKNLGVSKTGDAGSNATSTTIIDASGGKKSGTKQFLMKYYNLTTTTTTNPYSDIYDADFIIVLGPDRIPKPTSSQSAQQ